MSGHFAGLWPALRGPRLSRNLSLRRPSRGPSLSVPRTGMEGDGSGWSGRRCPLPPSPVGPCVCLLTVNSYSVSLPWKANTLVRVSASTVKGDTFPVTGSVTQEPASAQDNDGYPEDSSELLASTHRVDYVCCAVLIPLCILVKLCTCSVKLFPDPRALCFFRAGTREPLG